MIVKEKIPTQAERPTSYDTAVVVFGLVVLAVCSAVTIYAIYY